MSLMTWREEFCPVLADVFKGKRRTGANWLKALDHSILKWKGLGARVLARHSVKLEEYVGLRDSEGGVFGLGEGTCALCQMALDMEGILVCGLCPLLIVRGGYRCLIPRPREKASPYTLLLRRGGSPSSMLYWLRKAKRMLEEKRCLS